MYLILSAHLLGATLVSVLEDPSNPPALPKFKPELHKWYAEREHERSSLQIVDELAKEVTGQRVVTALPVRIIDPKQAREIINRLFKDNACLLIVPLAKRKCLALRTDPNTTAQIQLFLECLDQIASSKGGLAFRLHQTQGIPVTLNELEIARAHLRYLESLAPPQFP
ncbi:MAG: hypothetical protein L0241_12490 [Planctomycetia bacterium]|nr:hypothetical protein [Planctomycetia bacterium]